MNTAKNASEEHFLVNYSRKNLVFATLAEANGFCNEILRKTGYVLAVTSTNRPVTHSWG